MDTHSLGSVAELLHTSVPRVRRSVDALGITPQRGPRGLVLTEAQVSTIRGRLGVAPRVDGLTREDLFVLAALNRRPLGLRSVRAIARASSVSPTTAGKVVSRLMGMGLVVARPVRVLEGVVVDVTVFEVARSSARWLSIAREVRRVVLPLMPKPRPATRVPKRLWHLFWNGEPARIRLPADEDYVASRLLLSDDPQAIAWGATRLRPRAISQAAGLRGLSSRERSTLQHLAAAA